jgi:hypothetical protein
MAAALKNVGNAAPPMLSCWGEDAEDDVRRPAGGGNVTNTAPLLPLPPTKLADKGREDEADEE